MVAPRTGLALPGRGEGIIGVTPTAMDLARQYDIPDVLLAGFDPSAFRDLDHMRVAAVAHIVRQSRCATLAPLLPMLLSLKGKPYTLRNHFPMSHLFRTKIPRARTLKAGRQVSKTLRVTERNRLYLANGRPVSGHEVRVGDRVLSVDAHHRTAQGRVVDCIDSGHKSVLRMRTRMGREIELATTHPLRRLSGWTVGGELRVGDRVAAIRRGGQFGRSRTNPRVLLTAYMIGDGCCGLSGNWNFTAMAGPALEEFTRLASAQESQGVVVRQKTEDGAWSACMHADNRILRWMAEDGLAGCGSHEKFLPGWVFDLSRRAAADFISRLWATDGMVTTAGNGTPMIGYCSTSWRLSYDIQALLGKFGIPASVKRREASYRDDETGELVRCRDAYIVRVETREGWSRFMRTFEVPGKPPVPVPTTRSSGNRDTIPLEVRDLIREIAGSLVYKRENSLLSAGLRVKPKYALTYKKARRYLDHFEAHCPDHPRLEEFRDLIEGDLIWDEIVSIEPIGEHPCWDIEVETEHNYVINGLVNHNSTCLAALGTVQHNTIPWLSTIYITPLFEQIRRFSQNYIKSMIEDSPVASLFYGSRTVNSVLQRSFHNHSTMYFTFAFLSPDRARGIPADQVAYDEIQDIDPTFLPIINECLSGSENYKLLLHSGTPKTTDGTLEKVWQESSQSEFCIRCDACNHWNVPSLTHDLEDMVGPYREDISESSPGVICAECERPINPRNGRWIPAFPDRVEMHEGLHVPQIIMPVHYAHPHSWQLLLAKRAGVGGFTRNVYLNEVMGESFDIGAKLITQTDLKRAASLPWKNQDRECIRHIDDYVMRALGVDWGGGGQKGISTTVLAVVGMLPNGELETIWAYRSLTPLEHAREAQLCLKAFQEFRCTFLAHDYNGAGQVRETLLMHAGLPKPAILPMVYGVAGGNGIMEFKPATNKTPREYFMLHRTRSLFTCINEIKAMRLRFFQYDYRHKDSPGLIHDFLSLVEDKVHRDVGTDIYRILREASASDDFAHAVNFAACAMWQAKDNWPNMADPHGLTFDENILDTQVDLPWLDGGDENLADIIRGGGKD